jgi:hypothetical protein
MGFGDADSPSQDAPERIPTVESDEGLKDTSAKPILDHSSQSNELLDMLDPS